ncbi:MULTISPECIES: aspartate aminotransferase family protein [unclassified Achromobacter]|uniref:aspartate aminotransferase family protein n=1 Tax=unclassified Achromobacter TaxID=2626865 RepID=UPI000B51A805|nr:MULTISPECIES: aminotransferase class III-fold pyridoxal phosphate-dependent enzyme [unclassified Achromobacter]OWT73756.1 aspartate aminotransferase family protein [Achromobacter sp. HZ34]OWT79328.1 aspartate aminotransferase family protein [Achromobacter sp. HZ28]
MDNLIGDVSSSARILPDLNGQKLFIERAEGPYVWDTAGQRYIDTALGFGAILLGHSPPPVITAVSGALRSGAAPSFAHTREHPAASALAAHTRDLSRVMFTNSGSEAVHLACRAARAYTGKPVIAKMAGGFDGWFDEITLGNVGTEDALFPDSNRPMTGRTTLLRFNDGYDLERLFSTRQDIAAILFEPMLANAGCVLPAPGYLEKLQATARRHGVLLICDEVLMGFRLHPGLTSHLWGLAPDMATVGKAIGTGVPVAAVVGRPDILAPFAEGKVARGGTYSGNPLACAALLSTLEALDRQDYAALQKRGNRLRDALRTTFARHGIPVETSGYGTVFSMWPSAAVPRDYNDAARRVNSTFSTALHLALRSHGLLVMPSCYGRLYISFAHTDAVIEEMLDAADLAAADLSQSLALESLPGAG